MDRTYIKVNSIQFLHRSKKFADIGFTSAANTGAGLIHIRCAGKCSDGKRSASVDND